MLPSAGLRCQEIIGEADGPSRDARQFLSISHVLEFEPIYREEAKGRAGVGAFAQGPYAFFLRRAMAASTSSIFIVL